MKLYELVQDKSLMSDLRTYFEDVVEQEIIERVLETGSAIGCKEAKEMIDKAFENIEAQFAPEVKPKTQTNEAR